MKYVSGNPRCSLRSQHRGSLASLASRSVLRTSWTHSSGLAVSLRSLPPCFAPALRSLLVPRRSLRLSSSRGSLSSFVGAPAFRAPRSSSRSTLRPLLLAAAPRQGLRQSDSLRSDCCLIVGLLAAPLLSSGSCSLRWLRFSTRPSFLGSVVQLPPPP